MNSFFYFLGYAVGTVWNNIFLVLAAFSVYLAWTMFLQNRASSRKSSLELPTVHENGEDRH